MLLLKVKVTPKFKSKLYNYNKILKCINIKFEINISIIPNILYMICITMYSCMMEEIRLPIHKQIV